MPDFPDGLRHTGTVPLTTERLFLRRLTPDDADAMFANFASEEDVTRYMSWQAYRTAEELREKLTEWQTDYEEKKPLLGHFPEKHQRADRYNLSLHRRRNCAHRQRFVLSRQALVGQRLYAGSASRRDAARLLRDRLQPH